MTQRRFVAKLVLSCAGTDCTMLAASAFAGQIYGWPDTDATYADDGTRTAKDFCGAHVGRVVAVEGKDGQFSVGVEGAGNGGGERGVEGAARFGAKGDVRLKHLSATKNISYPACRALWEEKGRKTSERAAMREACVGCAPHCPHCFQLR